MKELQVAKKVPSQIPRWRRRLRLWLLLLLLAGTATTWLIQDHVQRSARPYLYAVGDVPPADCILVPGARIYANGEPYPMLVDRLAVAAELLRLGKAPRILVSGRGGGAVAVDEVAAMKNWLEARGVANTAIELDPQGLRSIDSLIKCRDVFGHRSVIVASNDFHVARMVFLGRHLGLEAFAVPAPELYRYSFCTLAKNRGREVLARVRACCDVYCFGVR